MPLMMKNRMMSGMVKVMQLAYHRLGGEQHAVRPIPGHRGRAAGRARMPATRLRTKFHGESRCWCLICYLILILMPLFNTNTASCLPSRWLTPGLNVLLSGC